MSKRGERFRPREGSKRSSWRRQQGKELSGRGLVDVRDQDVGDPLGVSL
jgi:hypothetical protein